MEQKQVTKIRPSATVLLLREAQNKVEVLMTRRHQAMSFMGGVWVYPGGSLDAADSSPAALARLTAEAKQHCTRVTRGPTMRHLAPEQAQGILVAAAREVFEEVGLVLARDAAGRPCQPALAQRLLNGRDAVLADAAAFPSMLARHGLSIDAEALVYWSHWITPSANPKRFDTHFFSMPVPEGQTVHVDSNESQEWRWQEPRAAIAAYERGEFALAPPTRLTLQEITDGFEAHGSLMAMLRAEAAREVLTILPKIHQDDPERTVMPWHPDYTTTPGESVTPGTVFSEYTRALPNTLKREGQAKK